MSLKNRLFPVLMVAIAVVGFATFTIAQDSTATTPAPDKTEKHEGGGWDREKGEGRGDHRGGSGGMMRMLHDVDLTEAQKTQIHTIMEANKPDRATMEEMHTLWKAKEDGTLTAAQKERLTTLKAQSMEKAKAVHQQIMAVLTPEQIAKLKQRKEEMHQRRQERKSDRPQTPPTADKPAVN